jgi:hypothetical protein
VALYGIALFPRPQLALISAPAGGSCSCFPVSSFASSDMARRYRLRPVR